ncbi:protein of unknown function [Paraburkholderia steynii]|uniref:DUF4123 domain-containing protein n=1 Tax=Paraburkholderia steynii TaxID=1245441 RepID=A0A7Z7B1T4_9BURK|nr:DUF4123 domain-containing protein [Paraburkholderia steynii]SDH18148.1 protein of unknown function [Paraburkholderia steynii]
MYLDFENGMLARFRAMHAELTASDPGVRLYALVDIGRMEVRERDFLFNDWDSQHIPLYSGSGLDHLEQTGPTLFAMPDIQGEETYTASFLNQQVNPLMVFWKVLQLAEIDAQLVSWVWTSCDMEPFVDHLQTLLHARLGPTEDDVWFFFYQPSYLQVLHRSLPDETRRHLFGPCHAWWTLNTRKRLVELAGESCTIPRAWDAFPIPAKTVTELQREVIPRQVLEWLDKATPGLIKSRHPNERMEEIGPFVTRALDYGLYSKTDVAAFVAYGLHYLHNYDTHPVLQQMLADQSASRLPLIDRYRAIGGDVWQELLTTRQQRVDEEKRANWHSKLQEAGRVKTTLRFVNARGKDINFVRFWFTDDEHIEYQKIHGGIKWNPRSPSFIERNHMEVPVPGLRMTVYWSEPYGWSEKHVLTVEGDLPIDENSGVLEVTLISKNPEAVMHSIDPLDLSITREQK